MPHGTSNVPTTGLVERNVKRLNLRTVRLSATVRPIANQLGLCPAKTTQWLLVSRGLKILAGRCAATRSARPPPPVDPPPSLRSSLVKRWRALC